MSKSMIDWPKELIEALSRRRCVVVIGSGVSKNSINEKGKRPATWEEFLRKCSGELIEDQDFINSLLDSRDYLTACEVVKNKLSEDDFFELVQNEYQRAGYAPADIHRHIYNLDASIVASPNFDNIYDTYASGISNGTLVIRDHTSQDTANYLLGGANRLLLKTHGSASVPQNIIFTRYDYAEARTKYVLFYEILKSLVLTHTFFFIGCGLDDPDIRMLFEDIQFAHSRMPFHYMTLPEDEVHKDILDISRKSMRIDFIKYSAMDGHSQLTNSLADLVDKVEYFRDQELRASLKW